MQSRTSEQDDAVLIAAVARGDASAFRLLVGRYAAMLHGLAYRMLGDRDGAEDVVQECFLRLWDHAASWQPQGAGLPGWLRRIATNLSIDRLRQTRRLSAEPVPECADERPAADSMLDGERLAASARQAVLSLPERQRAAVVLTYYEELSNAAAADVLQMNIKAFESLLFRARGTLRDELRSAGVSAESLGGGE